MIGVKDAFGIDRVRGVRHQAKLTRKVEITDDEMMAVDYLEASIESSIRREFTGEIFDINIPIKFASEGILTELKRRCNAAGWQVRAHRAPSDADSFRVVFAAGELPEEDGAPVVEAKTGLPPLALPPVSTNRVSPHMLVRMPTRGRPAQALSALAKYRGMAGMPIVIEVVLDHDDETMLTAEVMQRLAALECIVTVGHHSNKVEACNGGRVEGWEILVLASDDMFPVADGYACRIAAAMEEHFPHLDGAIFFNDGYQRSRLCTLPIMGYRLHAQFGFVYEPAYKSLFVDQEQTDILQAMGRLVYVDEKIIEHRHHVWGWGNKDALYERNDALESEDKLVYERRSQLPKAPHGQWAFRAPTMWLSILICTIPKRRAQLEWLVEHLYDQILLHRPRQVEILVDDRRGISVGTKRQALLERAKGSYITFIDDDDVVPHNYVERVIDALSTDAENTDTLPDSLSLEGIMTTDGARPERFVHSIHVEEWHTKGGIHYRSLNHLNVVRRELALEAGFGDEQVGEDHAYSKRLKPLVKTEVDMGEAPLYFYAYRTNASVQAAK